jgi:hypothetical protein
LTDITRHRISQEPYKKASGLPIYLMYQAEDDVVEVLSYSLEVTRINRIKLILAIFNIAA